MKRIKFRFLACVALLLAFVMFCEVPVSAVSYLNLDDYFVGSEVTGANIVSKYHYEQYETYSYSMSYVTTGSKIVDLASGNESSYYYTFSGTDCDYLSISLLPIGKRYPANYRINVPSCTSDVSSFVVNYPISVMADEDLYVEYYTTLYLYKDGSAVESDIFYTSAWITKSTDVYYTFSCDFIDYLPFDDFDSFFISYSVRFYSVSEGTTITFGVCLPDDFDVLDPGLAFELTQQKVQETPSFSTNLSTSEVSYLVGATPSALSVNASVSDGGTITYQWYKSSSASAAGSLISGATDKTYYPDTTVESDSYYYCVATSTLDGEQKTAKSNTAHISVVKKPLSPQIVSDLNDGAIIEYYQGRTAADMKFGVIVTDGGQLSYQWYQKSSSSAAGTKISGATSSTYRPPTSAIGLTYYYCVATNSKGSYSESVTSGTVGIRVVSPPDPAKAPVITSDLPSDPITYTEGDAAAPLRIGATSPDGGVLSYQWYEMVDGSGKALAGEIYPSFTPATSVPGEYVYYCVVTNALEDTVASVTSTYATIIVEEDRTDSLLDTIVGGVSDIIDGILNLPSLIIDGIKNLFVPDAEAMAAYQDKWSLLLSDRFGAIYESVALIDEFGQAISEQTKQGIVTFPSVTVDLAGTPWTFGGWEVKVVPDGFDAVIVTLKSAVNIVSTFAFVNGLRRRFEGIIGGA